MSICGEEIRRLESELENTNADMELYKKKSENIIKFLNDYYTETLERSDELAIVRTKTELDLVKKILDEIDKI